MNEILLFLDAEDNEIENFMNNKNKCIPSYLYILLLKNKYHLIEYIKTFGFYPDKNCVSISCLYANYEMLKVSISENNMPTESDVNNLLKYMIKEKIYYGIFDRWVTYIYLENILNCDVFYKNIERKINGINDVYNISKNNEIFEKKIELFVRCIKESAYWKFSKKEIKERQPRVVECLNLILSHGYKMTFDNWKKFVETEIPIIKIINNGNYTEYANAICEIKEYFVFESYHKNKGKTYIKKTIDTDAIIKKYNLQK